MPNIICELNECLNEALSRHFAGELHFGKQGEHLKGKHCVWCSVSCWKEAMIEEVVSLNYGEVGTPIDLYSMYTGSIDNGNWSRFLLIVSIKRTVPPTVTEIENVPKVFQRHWLKISTYTTLFCFQQVIQRKDSMVCEGTHITKEILVASAIKALILALM